MPPTVQIAPKPPLDSALAADCPPLPRPAKADYDAWEDYTIEVIGLYGDCAQRHRETVNAWPK